LDVDNKSSNIAPNPHPSLTPGSYKIPKDNPFIGLTKFLGTNVNPGKVRTEFYAFGMRNPWRFSIDPLTGLIFANDVGQYKWEEVNLVEKGGNYGWPFFEAREHFPHLAPENVLTNRFYPPIARYGYDYLGGGGKAVTAGMVYRGSLYPELDGAYLISDFYFQKVGAVRLPPGVTNVGPGHNLDIPVDWLSTGQNFGSFGMHPFTGEILGAGTLDFKIHKLVWNTNLVDAPLPEKLSQTGVFSDLKTLTPNPGILPYTVSTPFWSDNAIKRRWIALPDENASIEFKTNDFWNFPAGTVWIKHFDMEMTNGVASSTRRLETRLLVKIPSSSYGVTYKWNSDQTEAFLVPEDGIWEDLNRYVNGTLKPQRYIYPSRLGCVTCHNNATHALGFNTAQLNCDFDFGSGPVNQLNFLAQNGYFSAPIPSPKNLPALTQISNTNASREFRVRSYLHANCISCHRPGMGLQANWDARISTPLDSASLVNANSFYGASTETKIIRPGSLAKSILFQRMNNLDLIHMPPLGSTVLDEYALAVIARWITNDLPNRVTFSSWLDQHFPNTNSPSAQPLSDPDMDGYSNYAEFLIGSNPNSAANLWKALITSSAAENSYSINYTVPPHRKVQLQFSTNIFDPASWQPVESPLNAPFIWSFEKQLLLEEQIGSESKFYRLQISEQ
jgi:uncharacterized repeat protein (TIGR03806 family)